MVYLYIQIVYINDDEILYMATIKFFEINTNNMLMFLSCCDSQLIISKYRVIKP